MLQQHSTYIHFGTLFKTVKTILKAELYIVEELSKLYFSLQMHLPDESGIFFITYYTYCCILGYECVCFRKLHV